jgi:hypothetical protein
MVTLLCYRRLSLRNGQEDCTGLPHAAAAGHTIDTGSPSSIADRRTSSSSRKILCTLRFADDRSKSGLVKCIKHAALRNPQVQLRLQKEKTERALDNEAKNAIYNDFSQLARLHPIPTH